MCTAALILSGAAHVAQAERLYERQDRFALTTLYDTIMAGALPWTPENVRKLKEERRVSQNDR